MNFAEKLADLPGVTVRGNGSAASRPILRGLTDNEVLVIENGLRMGDIATFDPAHATPLEALGVAQVDVVRGPSAILYGPNTLGGLVNVITNIVPAISDHAFSGTLNLEGNSVNGEYSGFARNVWSGRNSAFSVSAGALKAGRHRHSGRHLHGSRRAALHSTSRRCRRPTSAAAKRDSATRIRATSACGASARSTSR